MIRSSGLDAWILALSSISFMVLRGVIATGIPNVSEAYSQYDGATTLYSAYNYLKCTSDHHVTVTSTNEIRDTR